jgi:hypothetical protein
MKYLILTVLLSSSIFSFGQGYYHGLGMQLLGGNQKIDYSYPGRTGSNDISYGVPSIFYKSTFMFNSNSISFGASAYPAIGAFTNEFGFGLGYTLPVNGEIYIGDIEDGCFFIGAGYSIGIVANDNDDLNVAGVNIALGGQLTIKDQLVGFRASFTPGMNTPKYPSDWIVTSDKRYMFTLGAYYPFGS